MSNIDRDTASAGGFGKMLTSLQGLQQRLEDFSIADVANAEANAQTLILRLRQVNDLIGSVALLKQAAVQVDRSLIETQQADLEAVELDSLENHPRLHAIVNASKLIKLHKLMTALKAGAAAGDPLDGPADADETAWVAETGLAQADDLADDSDIQIDEPAAANCRDLGAAPTDPLPAVEGEAISVVAESVTPAIESQAATDAPIADFDDAEVAPPDEITAREFPTAEAEFADAMAAGRTSSSILRDVLAEDFPASEESLSAVLPMPVEPVANLPEASETRDIAARNAKGKQPPVLVGAPSTAESKALALANESFDLRLLDDLVSNYGDFAANPNLPAKSVAKAKTELQIFTPAAETAQPAAPVEAEPMEAAAPPVRNTGDLDRQLKKIIKDYGEYDLYSDKPTTNLKKAGIIAFVFLGLVFGGIYFFKTPPSTAKTAPAASNIESGASAESKPQAGQAPGDSPEPTNLRQKH